MRVVALVGNKGGAGKTTLSVNLASALERRASAALVDADQQGSTLRWRALSESANLPLVLPGVVGLGDRVREALERHRYVVIDCPPSVVAPQTREALRICDLALIPVQPSPLDLWATVHIEQEVEAARTDNPALGALLVLNQLEPRTRLSRTVRLALEEMDIPAADTAIRRRVVYRTGALEGRSVFDMGSRGAAARVEIEQLIDEVMTHEQQRQDR